MSIESRRHQYGTVFGHWIIKESLGQGSGGKSAVFRLEHAESSTVESALKVVSLIEESGSLQELSPQRRADYERSCQEYSQWANQEVLLMNALQGNTYIVDYLDHTFADWSDANGFGRDMLIRMERLTDLRGKLRRGEVFPRSEIIKLGIHICNALILCHGKNILHRDIKPGNIFVNKNGDYKLGDFGISKILDSSATFMASTGIGTPQYWAPEQTSGHYDTRVDIYSLGLVLYELSNANRLPFATSSYVRESQVQRRLMGEALPMPCGADAALAAVILKACAYRPQDRYPTAEAFRDALMALEYSPAYDEQTLAAGPAGAVSEQTAAAVGYGNPAGMQYVAPQSYSTPVRQSYGIPQQQSYGAPAQQGYSYGNVSGQWNYDAAPAPQNEERNGRKKGLGLVIGIVSLILVLAIGAGAWWLLSGDDSSGGSDGNDRDTSEKADRDEDSAGNSGAQAGSKDGDTPSVTIDWSQGKDAIPQPTEDTAPPATTAPPVVATPTEPPAPDPAADLKAVLEDAEVGDIITFGNYEKDNNSSNGKEPIQWRVLAKENGQLLLISVYGLENKPFHHSYSAVTWETCSLRSWLNSSFYADAFSDLEKTLIPLSTVKAEVNPSYGNPAGNDTRDYVFVLSTSEAERYFTDAWDRRCQPTNYALRTGQVFLDNVYHDYGWWWLRNVGEYQQDACCVNSDGSVDYKDGTVNHPSAVVRPVIWVSYSQESTENAGGKQALSNLVASASSELKGSTYTHYASYAIDGSMDTAWSEGVSGVGVNEWLLLQSADGSQMEIDAIEFVLGYHRTAEILARNGWPRKVRIECEGFQQDVVFTEYTGVVELPRTVKTSWVRITILEAAAGTVYQDTCITEIRLR